MAYFWQYFLSSASLPRQPGLVTPPFPLRHLLVYFPVSVSWQWVPSAHWHGHHNGHLCGQANLPTAHLSKISLVNGNFPRSIHLKSVFTQSIFWNVCHFTIVKMSACILLEILWSVWSSFWGFKYFQIQILPFMNFTLCHMQFVKCVPLGVLAYILLFRVNFKRLCATCGPKKQTSWSPLAFVVGQHIWH